VRLAFQAGALSVVVDDRPQLFVALRMRRLRTIYRAEDIGSALKRGVNVCQREFVNEVLGPLVTEFVGNFGREGATPIQLGPNASLFGRVQAVKLIRHSASPAAPLATIRRAVRQPPLKRLRIARYPGG
jgi:hypothetical protein